MAPADAPPARPPRWRRLVRAVWLVAVGVTVALVLADRWEAVRAELALADPWLVVAGVAAGVAGVGASGGIWRTLLAGLGSPTGVREAVGIFFVGQLAKYLPGGVWTAVTHVELGRDRGVPPRATLSAVALFMWVHLWSGVTAAALLLPVAGHAHPALSLAALPALALMLPGLLDRAVTVALRVARRAPLPALPGAAAVTRALGWAAVMWLLWGLHLLAIQAALGAPPGIVAATGAYAAAWSVGFAFVIAPAGAGVREAMLVALLAGTAGADTALVVALLSRLAITAGDVVWGAAGLALRAVSRD